MSTPDKPDELENMAFTAIGGGSVSQQDGEEGEQPGPQELTNAQVIGGALAAARTVFCMVTKLQSPQVTLSDEKASEIGALWGPVADKRGLELSKMMGGYELEFAAIIGTVLIFKNVKEGVDKELKARKPVDVEAQEVAATEVKPEATNYGDQQ